MTKQEMKRTLQMALKSEYGFEPKVQDITIYEAYEEEQRLTHAVFSVNMIDYRFDSYVSHYGDFVTVWVGKGTITKVVK